MSKKNFTLLGIELGTTGLHCTGLHQCTTVVENVTVHRIIYSQKQMNGHVQAPYKQDMQC